MAKGLQLNPTLESKAPLKDIYTLTFVGPTIDSYYVAMIVQVYNFSIVTFISGFNFKIMNILKSVLETLRTKVGKTLGASVGITGGYVLYKDYARYPAMMETYAEGRLLPPFSSNK